MKRIPVDLERRHTHEAYTRILRAVQDQIDANQQLGKGLSGLEAHLWTSYRALSASTDSLLGTLQEAYAALDARPAPPREPFRSPQWVPSPLTENGTTPEWDAVMGEDLWTLRRVASYWYLLGSMWSNSEQVGDSTMHARHTAHRRIRKHYADQETSDDTE